MKGRILVTLFALPFFGVGVWMLWSVSGTFYDAWTMSSWQPVEAQLTAAGYTTSRGDDSDTYEVYAEYRYEYFGQTLYGNRPAINSGGDNIGDFQRDLGNRLSGALGRGEPITVWIDPEQPQDSIIDRSIRWGLIGFKSIFVFVFGGVGLFLLIAAFRAPKEKDTSLPEYQESPWLLNDKWQTEMIRSDSRSSMWSAWAFAGLWNAISAPLPFMMYGEIVEKENYLALIALLFPLVGIGLLVWAIKRSNEWRRFGPTPVTLDPFPGSIGGHVGGTIDTRLSYDSANEFRMTLTSIHSYMSGSGKSRSRRENAKWQDEIIAHTESGALGTRLTFRFDVPDGLQESDAQHSGDSYDLWRLNIAADLDGTDLDRSFEIPVYATATESKDLSARSMTTAKEKLSRAFDKDVREIVRVSFDGVVKKLVYPMGRNIFSNIFGVLFGAAFAAAGAFIIIKEEQTIFGSIFGGVGALVAIAALYMMFKSLHVTLEGNRITSTRRWLGIPLRRRTMSRHEFYRFEKDNSLSQQSGNKHVVLYSIRAIDRHVNELILGEGFRGESVANAAIQFLKDELGLQPQNVERENFDTELVNEF